ncbi:putative acetyl xylan esterase (Axe1) [Sclerotinia borealis F-4128]|uniref:Putative acetyl xylan esterase (Axe1) n=1 Tax=Sclerotinia borealis (strain F-4128) TaxID=1432307 RepID=W9CB24_SCLBF|nr:putative acetyl xylan esterase (Axe1) [Sclerotinia borealis F-4128]
MFSRTTLKTIFLSLLTYASALPSELDTRATCPGVHVFGARETTVSPGYGTAGVVINLILAAHSGATSEAIVYPACGGQSSCGGVSYGNSVVQGVAAVAAAVNAYNTQCPSTQLVLVGYSQGGQIMDDAFCGGGDANEGLTNTAIPIKASAVNMIKAAIFMGNPRYVYGLSYEVGTCRAQGFAPRPSGFSCPSASKIKSYCDSADPYCCTGSDANTHQGYGTEYGQQALTFVNAKLASSGTSPTTTPSSPGTTSTTTPSSPGSTGVAHWGQCGGTGYTGSTTCASPYTCVYANAYYAQCL